MPKQKVALLFICLNTRYWPFLQQVIEDARKHFLTNHEVNFFCWSDMPELGTEAFNSVLNQSPPKAELHVLLKNDFVALCQANPTASFDECIALWNQHYADRVNQVKSLVPREELKAHIEFLRTQKDIKIFPTEAVEWPFPTLMRYNLFLQQEEILKEYDHIFYLDVDMRIVDTVGEEVFSEGLTMAEHPMYSLRRDYIPPYEPNKDSTAYIPRLGAVITNEEGKPWFKPLYAAGGFQGGKSGPFIAAMRAMKNNIDADFLKNYIAIWNDESHWNRYLYGYSGPLKVLSPSYIHPDSLINEYYLKIWGQDYPAKIITLTKKFNTSAAAGKEIWKRMNTM